MKKRLLVVAAHPDDEVIGCGGTVARLVKAGYEAYTLILGEGITSRDEKRNRESRRKEITKLRKQVYKANKVLGVKEIFIYDFPDNRFDTVPLLDIVKVVERIKHKVKPEIIFTNYEEDLNIDHQITYKAVITATRPVQNEVVKEIYSFEVASSTEWNCHFSFYPNVFFDITDTMDKKIEALKIYKSEIRSFPHPRSVRAMKLNAQNWGIKTGLNYAETFKLIRLINRNENRV